MSGYCQYSLNNPTDPYPFLPDTSTHAYSREPHYCC